MLLTQPALGQVESFAVVAEIGSGPAVLGMLPERVGVVVLLVNRQRQRQVAIQLVKDLPFETREGQLMCARFGEQANENFFHNKAPARRKPAFPECHAPGSVDNFASPRYSRDRSPAINVELPSNARKRLADAGVKL